jgi:3-hydroxy-3-methylglutaryl CoA synthase
MMTLGLAIFVALALSILLMAAITRTLTCAWSGGDDVAPLAVQGSSVLAISEDIALTANQSNKQVALAFATAGLKALWISSDVNCVLKTNSSGSPTTTLTITAGVPCVWQTGCGLPAPFVAGDVTTTYWTNSNSTTAGTVKFRALTDGT